VNSAAKEKFDITRFIWGTTFGFRGEELFRAQATGEGRGAAGGRVLIKRV